MSVKVTLRIPENKQRAVTLPDDIPLSRLVPALANKLKMPFSDQGQTITYSLYHESSQTTLPSEQTLAEAGVQDGDIVRLEGTRGETAVVEPVPTISQNENAKYRSSPRPKPKKKRISTSIKIIIGVFVLLILCMCIAPFLFIFTAFNQFTSNMPSSFPIADIQNPLDSGIKPDMVWQLPVADVVMAAPAIDNGIVYFGVLSSENPDFYALDADTGKKLWQFTADDMIAWTPALSEDNVFFSTESGNLYALDRATGTEQWRFTPEQRNLDTGPDCDVCALKFSYPAVAYNTVYVGSLDNHLYALDATTGVEKWRFNAQDSVLDKPAIADNIVYFGNSDGVLYAVNAQTGEQLYQVKTTDRFADSIYTTNSISTPIIEGDVMYITDGDAAALNRQTGETIWRFAPAIERFNITKRPLSDDQHIYIMDNNIIIYALDKNTGISVWQHQYPDNYIPGQMVLDDGFIYFGDSNNRLVAIDSQTGKQHNAYNLSKQQLDPFDTVRDVVFTPAIDSGKAYLGWANQMNAIQLETP